MCGIVACVSAPNAPFPVDEFLELARQSLIRGLHAFGIAWLDASSGQLRMWRSMSVEEVRDVVRTIAPSVRSMLWHNRYSTSGDWHIMANNQPLIWRGYLALVFNGVLSMQGRSDLEESAGMQLPSENDGYLFLVKLERASGDAVPVLRALRGSFAGAWMLSTGEIWTGRNEKRPLWYAFSNEAHFVVSTADIARRALGLQAVAVPPYYSIQLGQDVNSDSWNYHSYASVV